MKLVYFGYDFMLGGLRRLLDDGHELAGVFTFECDNIFNFNRETIALAGEHNVKIITSPVQDLHLDHFIEEGAECFLSAGYPHKIPLPAQQEQTYALNLHPSLLPKGRGIMPTPHIIMNHPDAAGLTLHKLSEEFDKGDILTQEALALSDNETVETLSARIALRAPDMLSKIMSDLPNAWANATPQNESIASHFPPPDEQMRTLDWNKSVKDIDKTARAFGRYGSLATFEDQLWVIYALDVWEETHNLKPGTIAGRLSREIIIAAQDGFVCLKDFQNAQL